ncbi:hypothetical protein D3C83_137850 [compost metagenome]
MVNGPLAISPGIEGFDDSGSASAMSAMRSACRSSMRKSFHLSMRLITRVRNSILKPRNA